MIWKIAWASLLRHGRRSLLILLAVALSVAVMEFVVGMMTGMREDFFETMVSSGGHLRVEHIDSADALDPLSLELLISDWRKYDDWFRSRPEVVATEAVLPFGALLIHGETNAPMVGIGVSPDTSFYSDVRGGMEEGRFLGDGDGDGAGAGGGDTDNGYTADTDSSTADTDSSDTAAAPTSGEALNREILISTQTADMLDLVVGDSAMVLVEDSTGAPYYLDYLVAGIFRSDSGEFDDTSFLMSHDDARELLYVGEGTREIRVVLRSDDLADEVAAHFAGAFNDVSGAGSAGETLTASSPAVTVRTWRDIHGGTAVLLEMFDVFIYAINLLIVIVAATVITNAILMNVFEKAREYAAMRAVGMTARGIFRLVLAEGAVYGIVGSIIGLAVGIPLVIYFQHNGIDFGEVMESFNLGREINTRFSPLSSLMNALLGTLIAVGGSLYAGLISRRRTIMESMRGGTI